jgi:hypothetical protein
MKKLLYSLIFSLLAGGLFAQSATIDPNFVQIPKVAALPGCVVADKGKTVYNNTDNKMYYCNGTAWIDFSSTGGGAGVPSTGIVLSTENDNQNLISAGYQKDGFAFLEKYASNNTSTWAKSINTGTSNTLSIINISSGHTATWTGSKMLLWGGITSTYTYLNKGYLYDPNTNLNFEITQTAAPNVRSGHVAVWTGSKMIVWGGVGGSGSSGPSML